MARGRIGIIDTPNQRLVKHVTAARNGPTAFWCADNSAFGKHFNQVIWWRWLQRNAVHTGSCSFATLPDVVGNAQETLDRSLPWAEKVRDLGYPVALVAQDGLEHLTVPWDDFDVMFIGGSTDWKLSPMAASLTAEAINQGKTVHMGRVNSFKRLVYADKIGCVSADGTFLLFGPDRNVSRVLMWLEKINGHD